MKKLISLLIVFISLTSFGQSLDTVNVGATANSGTGDLLRNAFLKINRTIKYVNTNSLIGVTNSGSTQNTFLGYGAGTLTSGTGNTKLGYLSGNSSATGTNNTFLGVQSGYSSTTGSNNVFLGYKAGYAELGSNKLYIANNTGTPLIWADFNTHRTIFQGSIKGDSVISTIGFRFPDGTFQTTAAGVASYWSYSAPNIYPTSTVSNLFVGSTSSLGAYKLQITGTSIFTGLISANNGLSVLGGSLALASGTSVNKISTSNTLVEYSDNVIPTQKAVKDYVTTAIGGAVAPFTYVAPRIYPNNPTDNLILGSTSSPSAYKLWVTGGVSLSGSVKSIATDGDIDANNISTNTTKSNIIIASSTANAYSPLGTQNVLLGNINGGLGNALSTLNTVVGSMNGTVGVLSQNSLFGAAAGNSLQTASNNILIGTSAGNLLDVASNNTIIGTEAGSSLTTNTGAVMLGYQAGFSELNSNRLYIANSSTTTPLIYGVFPNSYLKFGSQDSTGFLSSLYLRSSLPKIYFGLGVTSSNYIGLSAANDFKINVNGTDVWRSYTASSKKHNTITADTTNVIGVFQINGSPVSGGGGLIGVTSNNLTSLGVGTGSGSWGNTFIGKYAGNVNTSYGNVYIGDSAGLKINYSGGHNNVIIGHLAGSGTANTGYYNTFLGYNSGFSTTGNENTFIGRGSGESTTSGNYNTFLGNISGQLNTSGSGNIFIGYNAGASNTTASNKLAIGSLGNDIITGDLTAKQLTINGSLNIGTAGQDTINGSQNQKNVAGISYLEYTGAASIVLNGLLGGIKGQELTIISTGSGQLSLSHNSTGTQKFVLGLATDLILKFASATNYPGARLVFNGTYWIQTGH